MKKKKIIKICIIVSLILIINYFVGGIVAASIVISNIFDHRGSNYSDLLLDENNIYKRIEEFDSFKNYEVYDFYSGKNRLKGYYHKIEDSKGLVISVHGMTSQAFNDDIEYQNYFVENGYSLFSIDLTASGNSEGKSMKGLHQSAYDVKACYDFLKNENMLEDNLILVGHSWGAYGVGASLSLGVDADYVITFSAFDNPYDTMVRYSVNAVGGFIYTTIPTFYITTSIKYGKNNTLSASKALKKSNCKSLIIHGENDKSIPYNKEALYAKMNENDKTKKILLEGISHSGPWRTKEANLYIEEIQSKIKELKKNKGDIKSYIDSIDKNKTSELNIDLFNEIKDFIE